MATEPLFENPFETETTQQIRNLARKFAEEKIKPLVEADEESETFRPALIQEMGALGLTGIATEERFGGLGLGYVDYIACLEEIAKINASYAISIAVSGLPQIILSQFGNESQKSQWIPKLASGEIIGSFGLSEAGSGSDAASLKTTATKSGDHYLLNGTKLWITQADSASIMIVMARTGSEGAKGVSAFIVPMNLPGISMGKREKKMGCSISHTMEVVFDQVKIPKENLLQEEGLGMKVALTALDSGRITIAATALGLSKGAIEVAKAHANLRKQFGKSILDFQGVGFLLADMITEYQCAKSLVERAAHMKDQGLPFSIAAAQAKLKATDAAMKITTDAVQVLGGSGYTQEFPAERYMREAKVLQIVEGTNQIQRLVIARAMKEES